MQGFKQILLEDRNTHLEHLEDEIINNGSSGAKTSIEFLKSIKKMLQGGKGGSNVSDKRHVPHTILRDTNTEKNKSIIKKK